MTAVIDRLELLYVNVDAEDGSHDIPDTFFPAPKYFSRSSEKPVKTILRLQVESDEKVNDAHLQHSAILKAAMGRELSENAQKLRWTASISERASDEWDRILDLDLM
jgi:hypothetical protein